MQVPRAGALRTSSNRRRETVSPSGVASLARTRSTFARTSSSTCGACARCSMNRSRKSASRSMVHTTRVWGRRWAAWAQSRSPSTQRNDLRSSRGFVLWVGLPVSSRCAGAGASNPARSTPSGTPSGLTASVVCRCRPRASAPVWFEPIAPRPCVWPRRAKLKLVVSWTHSTVSCEPMRSARARWGARMCSTLTSLSAGWSMSR